MAINAINYAPRANDAKCEGIGCSYKQSCGRFLRPIAMLQVWGAFYALPNDDCDYFEVPTVVAG
jgi:hypothetical protein